MKTKFLLPAGLSAVLLCGCASSETSCTPCRLSGPSSPTQRARDTALQRNKHIIHRYFEEWGNLGDTKAADELIAPNVTLRNPPAVLHSLEEYKQGMAAFHTAFPDLHFTVEDVVAEGDAVVVRWSLRGTHLGNYQGRPPTGKPVSVTGMSLFRLADGKIQQITVSMDRMGLSQQLGWLPEPPKSGK
jgi:steroid delta-isomerase-like uncharacterized protein